MDIDSIHVKILKVSNPINYTVQNLQITDEKLSDLENDLGYYFEKACKDRQFKNEIIEKNNLVIAYLIEENKYVRGLIKSIVRRGNGVNYVIALVDYGKTISTNDRSSLQKLPEKFIYDLPFRTPNFILSNLEPLATELSVEKDIKLCLIKNDEWTKAAHDYCINTLNQFNWNADAIIQQIESPYNYIGRLRFSNMISMNDMLLYSNYAAPIVPENTESIVSVAEELFSDVSSITNTSYERTFQENYQPSSKEDDYRPSSNFSNRLSDTLALSGSRESLQKMYSRPDSGLTIHEKMRLKAKSKARAKSNSSSETVKEIVDTKINSSRSSHYNSGVEKLHSSSDSCSSICHDQNTASNKHLALTSQTHSDTKESSQNSNSNYHLDIHNKSPVINECEELCPLTPDLFLSGSTDIKSIKPIKHQPTLESLSHVNDDYENLVNSDYRKVFTFGHTILPCWDINKSDPHIVKALSTLKIKALTPIQKYSMSAIHRGYDVTLIGTKSSGKSLSYLLMIFSWLDILEENKSLIGNGPIVLILCSSFSTVISVYNMCHAILQQTIIHGGELIRVIKLCSIELSELDKGELMNGCHILISTPTVINHFISQKHSFIKLNRLQYFVFEEAEALFDEKGTKEISKIFAHSRKDKDKSSKAYILCAAKWTKDVSSFCRNVMSNPVIYIEDLLEASNFVNMDFNLISTSTHKKDNELTSLLYQMPEVKTIIFASSENIDHVKELLEAQCFSVLVAHNGMTKSLLTSAVRNWICGITKNIFLIDDITYEDVKITDGMCLIHYDSPMRPQLFRNRFNVLLEEMQSSVKVHSGNLNDRIKANCSTHVILTMEEGRQANFFKRCFEGWGRKIPSTLQTIAEKRIKEKEDPSLPLCNNFKTFGRCNNCICRSRHIFYSLNTFYPDSGTVTLKIIKIFCANRYYAHVISIDSDLFLSRYSQLNMKLQAYFSQSVNRVSIKSPLVGKLAAIKNLDDTFSRVKILEVNTADVKIYQLDMGTTELTNTDRLLRLPDMFQGLPPQAVEIILANVQPIDESLNWQHKLNMFVSNLILNIECEGVILKSYDNIIWLESLRKVKKLAICNKPIEVFRLPKKLIREKLAIENPHHMEMLYPKFQLTMQDVAANMETNDVNQVPANSELEVIEEEESSESTEKNIKLSNNTMNHGEQIMYSEPVGFPIVNDKDVNSRNEGQSPSISPQILIGKRLAELRKQSKPTFSTDKLKLNELQSVFIPYVQSPSLFYIQNSGDGLEELNEEINSTELKVVKGLIKVGEFYLAPFGQDEQYFRSQAISLLPNNQVKIFCLDVGDTATVPRDELRILDKEFIEKLPFQAIRCSLTGIAPIDGKSWSSKAVDELWETVIDSSLRSLEVFALVTSELKPKKFFDISYEVVLFNYERTIILNELLVSKNLAQSVLTDFSKYKSYLLPEARDSAIYSESEYSEYIVCNSPEPTNQQSVPAKVLWYETELEVVLKVMLNDVVDYKLKVLEQRVEFSCWIGKTLFGNNMDLFAPVIPKKYTANVYPSNVSIRLTKASRLRWRNLLAREKPFWLKFDSDHIDVSDSEESTRPESRLERKFVEVDKVGRLKHEPLVYSDSSSLGDDSDFD